MGKGPNETEIRSKLEIIKIINQNLKLTAKCDSLINANIDQNTHRCHRYSDA